MGRPKPRPDAARPGGRYPAGVLENPEPIAERFAHSTDLRQALIRAAGAPPPRQARQVSAPKAMPGKAASPRARWPIRNRLLVAGLCLATLSLVLGALWLGLRGGTATPTSAPVQELPNPAPAAVLTAADRIEIVGGSAVHFPVALDGTDSVPLRSVIAIKGLPQGSNFSEGRPYGDREWSLRPDQIGDLSLVVPAGTNGAFELSIALIAPDDRVIAEARSLVVARPPPEPVAPEENDIALATGEQTAALAPDDGGTAALPSQVDGEAAPETVGPDAENSGAASPESEPAALEAADTPAEDNEAADTPPQDRPPVDSAAAEEAATSELGSVQPSVYVNMREGPSSSSPVLGIIAKGAELPVLDRQRGWVKVAHPETGKQGWIYSGLLVGEAKPNQRIRRIAPAESEASSESFWERVGRWLSPTPEQSNAN